MGWHYFNQCFSQLLQNISGRHQKLIKLTCNIPILISAIIKKPVMNDNYFCSKKMQIILLPRLPRAPGLYVRCSHTQIFEGTKADFRSVNSYVSLTLTVQLPAEESTPCLHQRACFILVSVSILSTKGAVCGLHIRQWSAGAYF